MSTQRKKGDRWERILAKELGGKRQPSSGAFGTQHKDASLTGDVIVKYPWWRELHIECKVGYGGSKQMSVKREWFTKVRKEAEAARRYPAVALRYKNVTGGDIGSAEIVAFNIDTWRRMMRELSFLYEEYLGFLKERYEKENEDGTTK